MVTIDPSEFPHAVVRAESVHPPHGLFAGLGQHRPSDKEETQGWFVRIRPNTSNRGPCEVRVCLLVTDRSGAFCGWVPFVVNTGTDITVIPRHLLPGYAFKGMDSGLCPLSGLLGGRSIGRRYPASITIRAPRVDGGAIHLTGLEPAIADAWPGGYGHLGMDVLERVMTVSDGRHFSFWPIP